ncbi:MAG: DVUA0089 family protein, partial [Pirellulaceae bacterium]
CTFGFLAAFAAQVTPAQAAVISSSSAPDFASAQLIGIGDFSTAFDSNILDSTTIPHVEIIQLGRASEGRDFYRFSHNGGTVHLDVDSSPITTSFDTWIGIWDAVGNLVGEMDDNGGDPGDISGVDVGGFYNSNLSNLNLAAGDYIVGVARYDSTFSNGGIVNGELIPVGGTYTLIISANVPEPSTLAMVGLLSCGFGFRSYRRRQERIQLQA